jgi:hypothetical protein
MSDERTREEGRKGESSIILRQSSIVNIQFLMSYLMYCIFHGSEVQRQETLTGVGGQPVFPVAINGIGAAVSEISDAYLTPDVPRVMAYKKVIESFHSDRTVIPMRYGCVLRDRPQVIQLLKRNARRYESLLKELDGCAEMGIRVMIADCRLSIEDLRNSELGIRNSELENFDPQSAIRNPKSKITGRAYLAARKEHYAQEECITEAKNEIAEQFRAALAGLFVKCKVETAPILNRQSATKTADNSPIPNQQSQIADLQSSMLSLYFLVPKKSIDPFRRVFRHMRRRMETTKLLLSGPWPPYSFVLPDNEERRSGLQDEEVKER